MRKQPKQAPWPVLIILLPLAIIMQVWKLAGLLIDCIWDGIQSLGPRFQGFVLGVWAGIGIFAGLCFMAMFSY